MRTLILAGCTAVLLAVTGCGPKAPPVPPPPPPTKASLLAEGQGKVKKALLTIEEIEQIRGVTPEASEPPPEPPPPPKGKKGKGQKAAAVPAVAPAPPLPPGMDAAAAQEIDRQLNRAREVKDQIVQLREELQEVLEKAAEPIAGRDLERARAIIARMGEKLGDMRDCKNRATELKPKEPEKEKPKADAPAKAGAPTPPPGPAKKK
jgi:hypothetical protein